MLQQKYVDSDLIMTVIDERDESAGKIDAETLSRVCVECFPKTFFADSKLDGCMEKFDHRSCEKE